MPAVTARRVPLRNAMTWARARPWVPLALIFLVTTAFLAYWTGRVGRFEIMTDEMLYQRMALGFLETLSPIPHVHDQSVAYPSLTYPLLIAPTQLLGLEDGFRAAHLLNAALMASVCIPVFLLARSGGASLPAAWLAAAISALVPWTIFSAMLLTEVAAYPVFVWGLLGIQRCIMSPSPRNDLMALAAIGLAFLTRTQFALLAVVLPVALLVHEGAWAGSTSTGGARHRREAIVTRLRAVWREHVVLVASAGVGLLALVLLEVTGGVMRIFGAYEGIASGSVLVEGIGLHMRALLAVVAVGLGVVPLVGWSIWAIGSIVRPTHKGTHSLAVLSIVAIGAVLLVAASFNLRTYGLVQERYAFYFAPLLVIGLLMLFERRTHLVALAAGGAFSVWIMLAYSDALEKSYTSLGAFSAVHTDITEAVGELIRRPELSFNQFVVAITVAAAALVVPLQRTARRARFVWAAGALALAFVSWHTAYVLDDFVRARSPLVRGQDWVDRAVGQDSTVATLPALVGDPRQSLDVWWTAEFWNRSVRRQWLHSGTVFRPTPFPTEELRLEASNGLIEVDNPVPYVIQPLNDKRFGLQGHQLARTDVLQLVDAVLPLRAAWTINGTNVDGWSAPRRPVRIRVFAPRGARGPTLAKVRINLLSDPSLTRRTYAIRGGVKEVRGAVEPGAQSHPSVAVCVPPRGHVDIVVRVPEASLLRTSPSRVGLAFTGVRTRYGKACSFRALD